MGPTAVALDAQGGASPVDAETIEGLEHGAPVLFTQAGVFEDEGDGDTLTGGNLADVASSATAMRHVVLFVLRRSYLKETECRR
jgi:hypothetical protein